MNSLKEITQVIARLKLEKIEIIDEEPRLGDPDNISKLYFGIKSNSLTSDQQAAQLIYGSTLVDTRFTTLKNRLKNRLLNTLFFLDIRPPQQSEFAEAAYKTYKYVFFAKTLLFLGARSSGAKLAEKALNKAVRYSLTADAVHLLIELRNYASVSGSEAEYNTVNQKLQEQTNNLICELKAREYFERMALKFSKSNVTGPELQETCRNYVNDLEELSPQPNSFNFNIYQYRIKNYYYNLGQQYKEAIHVCKEAQEYLTSVPHLSSNIRMGEFVINELSLYTNTKEYEEGKKAAERCNILYPPTTNTWFTFMEYYFLLTMHTEHFEEAESVYNKVVENPRYNFQLEQIKERWLLYEAFLQFALTITSQAPVKKFDINRFLRDVPNYKKDKRGYNVSILILQIIMLLEQNDFDGIINRMDALRTYRQRYLGSSTNKQSALFFKMLMVMEKSFFTYEETKSKAEKYYDKMLEIGSNSDETQEGLQILPFEWLWNRILDMLKEKERLGIIR